MSLTEADRDLGDIEGDVPDDEPPLIDNDAVLSDVPDGEAP